MAIQVCLGELGEKAMIHSKSSNAHGPNDGSGAVWGVSRLIGVRKSCADFQF